MENKFIFEKLTPTNEVDLKVYNEAMEYVFANLDIRNIAISGPYGAGKSSLLETYKRKTRKKFLHISLAHFVEYNSEEEKCEHNEGSNVESVLEGKILNQLIQQIPPQNIPQTNFKIKRSASNSMCVCGTAIAIIFTLCILHIKYFSSWSQWVADLEWSCLKKIFELFTVPDSLVVTGVIAVAMFGVAIYMIMKMQKNKNILRKLSVQGNEIEIFSEEKSSYFDKYLNEVLYLFEKANVDAIVFEDLDRFDDIKIFERLREINALANVRVAGSKKGKTVLRFFYLIRDDIFVNRDRTKFFDFILPIIPVLDSSNSYNQFKRHFVKAGIFSKFEEKFLLGLSLYIDDMRILKNIYNEFMVYYGKLNKIDLNPNKMLAIITYKNLFPRDYSALQLNQGFVFELFKRKGDFIRNELQKCAAKIEEKKEQIKFYESEMLEDIQELNDVKEAKRNRIYSYSSSRRIQELEEYNEWEKKIYPLRKQAIENRINSRLNVLQRELDELQQEYQNIENRLLSEIITRENIDSIFQTSSINEIGKRNSFLEIKGSEYFDLLKFLVRNGYLDESYSDYMTFFYEDSLSRTDKMFLRSVTDKKAKGYEYKLENVNLVMQNLVISDFDQQEILNYDLFEYLLRKKEYAEIMKRLVKQLIDNNNVDFVVGFFNTKRSRREIVRTINTQWPLFWLEAAVSGEIRFVHEYSIASLQYMHDESLLTINVDERLTQYISMKSDYLAFESDCIEKIINAFEILNVSFVRINYEVSNKNLFIEVYRKSLYQISIENISLMLTVIYQISNVEYTLSDYVSTVFSRGDEPFCKYIKENMDLFIEVLLTETDKKFTDKNDEVIFVLNHENITEQNKVAYIQRLQTQVEVLADINDTMYQTELIGVNMVVYNAENIYTYFSKMGMTHNLVKFINSGKGILDFNTIDGIQSEIEKFRDACVECDGLDEMKFREIILSIPVKYDEFVIGGIPINKVKILIEDNVIPMTCDTLTFMREEYPGISLKYVEKNLLTYVQIAKGKMASNEEVEEILSWSITEEIKLNLLSEVTGKISVIGKNYSTNIVSHILKSNLEDEDVPVLYKNYGKYVSEIKNCIRDIAKKQIAAIIADSKNVSKDLLLELISEKDMVYERRVDLFVKVIEECNKNECMWCLEKLELGEVAKLFVANKKPKILVNPINKRVLEALKKCHFIANFVEDKEKKMFKCTRLKLSKRDLPMELL